jgi:hypothetical protein
MDVVKNLNFKKINFLNVKSYTQIYIYFFIKKILWSIHTIGRQSSNKKQNNIQSRLFSLKFIYLEEEIM